MALAEAIAATVAALLRRFFIFNLGGEKRFVTPTLYIRKRRVKWI